MSFKVGIVASEFNQEYTDALVEHAKKALEGHEVVVTHVPGAFEIPLAVKQLIKRDSIQAVIALGLIWQGKTAHADLLATTVSQALMDLMLEYEKPVIHQVLSVETEKQAEQRCMGKKLNRGREAGEVVVKLLENLG